MPQFGRGGLKVHGLLPEVEDEDLQAYFLTWGAVTEAAVIRDARTLLSKCNGHVKMEDASAVEEILKAGKHELWGQPIIVSADGGDAPRSFFARPARRPSGADEGGETRKVPVPRLVGKAAGLIRGLIMRHPDCDIHYDVAAQVVNVRGTPDKADAAVAELKAKVAEYSKDGKPDGAAAGAEAGKPTPGPSSAVDGRKRTTYSRGPEAGGDGGRPEPYKGAGKSLPYASAGGKPEPYRAGVVPSGPYGGKGSGPFGKGDSARPSAVSDRKDVYYGRSFEAKPTYGKGAEAGKADSMSDFQWGQGFDNSKSKGKGEPKGSAAGGISRDARKEDDRQGRRGDDRERRADDRNDRPRVGPSARDDRKRDDQYGAASRDGRSGRPKPY